MMTVFPNEFSAFFFFSKNSRFVNEIIGKCLNILSIGCKQFNEEQNYHQLRLNPFHLFSLVDCETKWFVQSTHGAYCCNALIVQLKNNYDLFEFCILICLIYMNRNNGNNLFSTNQPITVNLFLCTMLQFLHRTIFMAEDIHQTYHPFMIIKNCLIKLTSYETVSKSCATHDNLIDRKHAHIQQSLHSESSSLRSTMMKGDDDDDGDEDDMNLIQMKETDLSFISLLIKYLFEFCLNKDPIKLEFIHLYKYETFVEIFHSILSHKTGQTILQHLLSKPLNLIKNLLDFTIKLLYHLVTIKRNSISSVEEYCILLLNTLIKVVHCGHHITRRGISLHFEDIQDFTAVLINVWYQIQEPKLMCELRAHLSSTTTTTTQETILNELKHCLIYTLGSPIGVELFTQSNLSLLMDCMTNLQKYLLNEYNIIFRRPHTCGFVLSQLALNKFSLIALLQSGIMSLLIKHAWQSIEYFDSTGHINLTGNYYSTTIKTYNPPIWSIDPIDKIAYKPFVNLVRVTTSYESIENLLSRMDLLTNKDYYDIRLDVPTNLSQFIDRIIFVNSSSSNTAKLHSLFNSDQCQVFGLRFVHTYMVVCLYVYV
ncbi:unnamed protein product [Schistosoma turkestanicum]|nr:unnamed protein product [Schistosoma turkestanicum]